MMYKQYPYKNNPLTYWTYGISDINNESIVDPNNIFGDLIEECYQNIPGNYLNHEKLHNLIFEKKYAFHTRNEAKQACLEKLIEIVKNGKNTNS